MGLMVGGVGLLATAVVGLGHRYHLFDSGRKRRHPRTPPGHPQWTDKANTRRDPSRGNGTVARTNPALRPRGGDSRPGGSERPRPIVDPRRFPPTQTPPIQHPAPRRSKLQPDAAIDTVLLQPVPAWSQPAPVSAVAAPPPPIREQSHTEVYVSQASGRQSQPTPDQPPAGQSAAVAPPSGAAASQVGKSGVVAPRSGVAASHVGQSGVAASHVGQSGVAASHVGQSNGAQVNGAQAAAVHVAEGHSNRGRQQAQPDYSRQGQLHQSELAHPSPPRNDPRRNDVPRPELPQADLIIPVITGEVAEQETAPIVRPFPGRTTMTEVVTDIVVTEVIVT